MDRVETDPAELRIETARLILRPPRPDDAWRIADLINDYDIVRMLSRAPFPYAVSDAGAFIARSRAADHRRDRLLVIQHRDFGLIGSIGVHTEAGGLAPELGYWLGRTFWGRGFATEAVGAALAWSASAWDRRAILSGHYVDNPASGQVLQKAGFLYTGEVRLRDCLARGERVATRMMVWLA